MDHRSSQQEHQEYPSQDGSNIQELGQKASIFLIDYRTSIRTSTGATPYSLVYGSEAVLPIEVEIKFLRVLVETKVFEEEWMKERYEQLALIDDKRARAQYHA